MRQPARKKPVKKPIEPLGPERTIPPGLTWYVFETAPNREYSVARWLEHEWMVFTLVPLETRWRLKDARRGGKRQARESYQVPVFPRLVLVGFSVRPNWLGVMNHFHITGVLGFNGQQMPMRKGEAERIQRTSEAVRHVSQPKPLAAGAKATVIAPGLFCGHVCEIKSLKGKKAVIVQNWFGTDRTVEISTDDLEAA